MGASFIGNRLDFPHTIGSGYMQVIELPDGMEALVSDLLLHEDILLERKKESSEQYTLICEELSRVKEFTIRIGSDITTVSDERTAGMYLTGFMHGVSYFLSKGTRLRGIRVLLSPFWMKKYLHMQEKQDVLVRYIGLKTRGVWNRTMDNEALHLIDEILSAEEGTRPLLYIQVRVLRLLEKFFNWLDDQSASIPESREISREDISRLIAAEKELLNDFSIPAPTITTLSKHAAMSESKFKKIFKTVYGLPVYQYFQDHRMERARNLLLSGNYSVSEVGYAVGYANLSNFSTAFRKKYNKLPSEVR